MVSVENEPPPQKKKPTTIYLAVVPTFIGHVFSSRKILIFFVRQ